jgi:5-methyltetrahydrofolate--homocysteine methyltransferase
MEDTEYYEKIINAVNEYREDSFVESLVRKALSRGADPLMLIDKGLMPGIRKVSDCFSTGTIYLPELMLSAKVMKTALKILEPEIKKNKQSRKILARAIMGTVKGDVHDVGKGIVIMMMEVAGFEVYDLGIDISVEGFLQAIDKYHPAIVGAGAFLSTTIGEQKKVIEAINSSKKRYDIKYFVGGTAATKDWADEIGADGYADNAIDAVKKMKNALGVI